MDTNIECVFRAFLASNIFSLNHDVSVRVLVKFCTSSFLLNILPHYISIICSFIGLGLFVALPLALLRNVESLAGLCTASIGFYLTVLFYIVMASWSSLLEGSWTSNINFWRPSGIFQCLPIFTMALSCQP